MFKSFKQFLQESKNSVGIFLGRFQPCSKIHESIIKRMGKENEKGYVFLVKGAKSSEDKTKNPFDENIQKEMLKAIIPSNVEIVVIPTGNFIQEINKMPEGKEYNVYAGTDRLKAYERLANYAEGDRKINLVEIKRTDEDISATKIRNALKEDDFDTFKEMTPKKIHSMYDELKKYIV